MSGVKGDFKKLERLQKKLLTDLDVPKKAAPRVAPAFTSFVQNSFSASVDPYLSAWKPIKAATYRAGSSSPLFRTGDLARAMAFNAAGSKVRLDWSKPISKHGKKPQPYAKFHFSTGRAFVPSSKRLPTHWAKAIETEVSRAVNDVARGI